MELRMLVTLSISKGLGISRLLTLTVELTQELVAWGRGNVTMMKLSSNSSRAAIHRRKLPITPIRFCGGTGERVRLVAEAVIHSVTKSLGGAFLLMTIVWLSVAIERSCSSGVISMTMPGATTVGEG